MLKRLTFATIALLTMMDAECKTIVLDQNATATSATTFRDVREALAAMTDGTPTDPTTLIVRPGVYWLDDPEDPEVRRPAPGDGTIPYAARLSASHIIIRAESANPQETIFAVNRGQTQGADGNYTMLRVEGHDIGVENITFGNYCNVDLEYPSDPRQNRARRADAIVQAQIAICHNSDRLHFRNCRFISRLNLCPFVGARRTLYENCHFECTDDALNGAAIYVNCDFEFFSGKPFYSTSETGAIMLGCKIKSHTNGTQCLTKVGGPLTMIDTEISGPQISELVWSRGNENYTCYTRNVTLNGEKADFDPGKPWRTVEIDGREVAKAYFCPDGKYNIGGLTCGADGWNPTKQADVAAHPVTYKIECDKKEFANGEQATMRKRTLLWGGWEPCATESETMTCRHEDWRTETRRLTRETTQGLRASTTITEKGRLRNAPTSTRQHRLIQMRNGLMRISYNISESEPNDSAGNKETSLVTWMRREKDGRVTKLKESRSQGKETYMPTMADNNRYVMVRVTPQRASTSEGTPLFDEVLNNHTEAGWTSIATDFSDVPVVHSDDLTLRGVWLMDAHKPADTDYYEWRALSSPERPAWQYGKGVDGAAQSVGLVTENRGARLTYNAPKERCKAMTLDIRMDPCKPAGQGFGSATGQYVDIVIGFDVENGVGFGVRIERTPEYDKAVAISLMQYIGGEARQLTRPQKCSDFRPGFEATLSIANGMLTSIVGNNGKSEVLGAPIDSCVFATGLRIQHTGTVGGGGLVIRDVKIAVE